MSASEELGLVLNDFTAAIARISAQANAIAAPPRLRLTWPVQWCKGCGRLESQGHHE